MLNGVRLLAVLCLVFAAVLLKAQQQANIVSAASETFEDFFSPRPILYLQVKDAAGLIGRFQQSAHKPAYDESRNFEDFQKSRLYNKLELRIKEMEAVAGFGINLNNLKSFLGRESAFWLYDIQDLKFVAATSVEKLVDYCQNTPPDPLRSYACVQQRIALIKRNLALLPKTKARTK